MDLFKDLLWENILKGAVERMLSRYPILGWGPVSWFVTFLIGEFADALYLILKEWFDLEAIAIKKRDLRLAFDRAGVECKIIARSHGIESPEFRKARDEHKADLSKFVRRTKPAA